MCKQTLPQEESSRVFAVGHKVLYQGQEAEILSIRVFHDKGTALPPPYRYMVTFDLKMAHGTVTNARFEDLEIWHDFRMPNLRRSEDA